MWISEGKIFPRRRLDTDMAAGLVYLKGVEARVTEEEWTRGRVVSR